MKSKPSEESFPKEKGWIQWTPQLYVQGQQLEKNLLVDSYFATNNHWRSSLIEGLKSKGNPSINGHWAAAYYNDEQNELILSRDRIGARFIYYYENEEFLLFSNKIKWILKCPYYQGGLNKKAAQAFLLNNNYSVNNEILFEGIKELPAASHMVISNNSLQKKIIIYYKLPYSSAYEKYNPDTLKENSKKIRSLLARTMKSTITGKPTACFLSGGMDSSILSYEFDKVYQDQSSFFSISFPDRPQDEFTFAKTMAESLNGSDLNEVNPKSQDFYKSIEDLHRAIELPTLSAGTYLQYALFAAVKNKGVDMVIDGTGADALFAGHKPYLHYFNAELKALKKEDELKVEKEITSNEGLKADLRSYLLHSNLLGILPNWISQKLKKSYYSEWKYFDPAFLKDPSISKAKPKNTGLNAVLYHDYFHGPVRELLRFTDRLSHHFGVSVTHPFVENPELMEYIFSIPSRYKIYKGELKHLLREAYRGILPDVIINRSDKKGLEAPNNAWIRDHKEKWINYFEDLPDGILNLEKIREDADSLFNPTTDIENFRIFKFISFAIWYQVHKEYLNKP